MYWICRCSIIEYLVDYLDTRDPIESIISPSVMGISDPRLVGLVNEVSRLQQTRKQLAFTVNESLPQLEIIDKEYADARAALRENVNSAISQLKLSMNNINQRIAAVEKELGRLPGTERSLIGIQRKFDLNNSVYTYLLERRAEAGIAKASQITDNRIIDEAMTQNSTRVKPKESKNYLTAALLGLMIPMLLIVVFDLLNNKIIGRHDIERITKAPIIGYISHSEYKIEDPVAEKPGSTLAESFRAVRTSPGLLYRADQMSCHSDQLTRKRRGQDIRLGEPCYHHLHDEQEGSDCRSRPAQTEGARHSESRQRPRNEPVP